MKTMIWNQYRMVAEAVLEEDGGGYRVFYPTLGYAVYGSGDTLDEAMSALVESQEAFEQFMEATPSYELPRPALEDLEAARRLEQSGGVASHNFAYAA